MEDTEKKEILIVDDEMDFRLSLAEILVDYGYKVSTARSSNEALWLLKTCNKLPDLVTIDMVMPGLDGFSFCQLLKKQFHLPTILISGQRLPEINLPKFFNAVLEKPINKIELLNVLESYL